MPAGGLTVRRRTTAWLSSRRRRTACGSRSSSPTTAQPDDVPADAGGGVAAAGLAVDRSFDPFGEPLASAGGILRVGFQGSWTDPATAKVSAQARWYTPGTGGFASRDSYDVPFGGSASANRYLYGNANPLTYNDSSGLLFNPVSEGFSYVGDKVGEASEWVGDAAVELGQTTWEWGVAQVTDPVNAIRRGDVGGVLRGTGKLAAKGLGAPLTAADYLNYTIRNFDAPDWPDDDEPDSSGRRDRPGSGAEPLPFDSSPGTAGGSAPSAAPAGPGVPRPVVRPVGPRPSAPGRPGGRSSGVPRPARVTTSAPGRR